MEKLKNWLKNEVSETKVLFKSLPLVPTTLFIVSVVAMNLMAAKALVNESWIALDAGILVSWFSFLTMDMIVKRFGPRAAIKVNLLAVFVNLVVMGLLTIAAVMPGDWALNDYGTGTNWWIIGASTAAFIISGVVNSFIGWAIKKMFKKNPNGVGAYIASSYVSTTVGQFVDNLVFALIFTFPASIIGLWGMERMTVLALIMYAAVGAVVELLCQVVFSPIGYKVAENWRKHDVGKDYIELIESRNEVL